MKEISLTNTVIILAVIFAIPLAVFVVSELCR